MTWFKVDDGFWSHPKTAALSDSAVATWVRAGSYSCQHLTDGFIATAVLRMVGDKDTAGELVTAGLWDIVAGGWQFHDWDEYQETSTAVKERRAAARDRQRKSRAAREAKKAAAKANSSARSADVTGSSHVTDDVTAQEVPEKFLTPDPTVGRVGTSYRPLPTEPNNSSPISSATHDRAEARESGGEVVSLRQPRGGLEVAQRWNETAHSNDAHKIVRQYERHIGAPVPGEVMSGMAQRIDECLASGISPEQIARGLAEWHTSPSWATSQIPSFVHKAAARPANKPVGVGKPTQKAQSINDAGEALIAQMRAEK